MKKRRLNSTLVWGAVVLVAAVGAGIYLNKVTKDSIKDAPSKRDKRKKRVRKFFLPF
jgi:hypothetical protein